MKRGCTVMSAAGRGLKRQGVRSELILKLLTLVMLAFFLIFLAFPVLMIFIKVFQNNRGEFVGWENVIKYFSTPSLIRSIGNSIHVSVLTTVISVGLAFGVAYGVTRTAMPFKRGFQYIAMLPQFVPTMVHGMALVYLFGKQGLLTRLGWDIGLYGETGVLLAEVLYTFPQVLMVLIVAMSSADNRLYEAATCLGAGPVRTFFRVTLPGAKYGLISAVTIAFTKSFTDFGAPQVVGGNFTVVATDIYKQVLGQQNMSMGAVVGIILTIPAILAFIVDSAVKSKAGGDAVSSKAVAFRPVKSRLRDRLFFAYSCLISLLVIGMFAVVAFAAFAKRWPYDFSLTLKHFDFDAVLLNSGSKAIWVSIKMSLLTAVIGGILSFLFAYLVEKGKPMPRLRSVCRFFSMIPMALPGLVIGLAYVMFFNKPSFAIPFLGLSIPNPFSSLYRTLAIMVISNIVHMFSVTYVTATTALKKLDAEYENVADSMSVPFYQVFLHVSVPMSIAAILESVMYYFVNTMVTISALVFLYTVRNEPMAMAILNLDENGDYASAAAMSLIILGINVAVRALYELYRYFAQRHAGRFLGRGAAAENAPGDPVAREILAEIQSGS